MLNVFKLKIIKILKSSGWGLEKSKLPLEQNVFKAISVFPVELLASLARFNGVCWKLTKITFFILNIMLDLVYDIISHLICISCRFFKLKYFWNEHRYLQTSILRYQCTSNLIIFQKYVFRFFR